MLRLFRKKANPEYLAGASKYLKEKYKPTVQYSIGPFPVNPVKPATSPEKTSTGQSDQKTEKPEGIKYSLPIEKPSVQYSLKQSYDSSKIDKEMEKHLDSEKDDEIEKSLSKFLNSTFVEHLCEYIRQKNLKDPEVYKAARIDRRLFSKIMSDSNYKPAKDTAVALAFALHLSLEEAEQLLKSAGYVFSHSIQRDVIIEYFFRTKIYNLTDVNAVLYRMGQKEIGR